MLRAIIGFILLLWVLGIVLRIAGAFIHLLLVIAIVVIMIKLISKISRN